MTLCQKQPSVLITIAHGSRIALHIPSNPNQLNVSWLQRSVGLIVHRLESVFRREARRGHGGILMPTELVERVVIKKKEIDMKKYLDQMVGINWWE